MEKMKDVKKGDVPRQRLSLKYTENQKCYKIICLCQRLMLTKITFFIWHMVKPKSLFCFALKFNHTICAMRYKTNLKHFYSFKNEHATDVTKLQE